MSNPIITEVFTSFQDYLDNEQDVRDEIRSIIKECDKHSREIVTELQIIHSDISHEATNKACLKARELYANIQRDFQKLTKVIPEKQYYRYNDCWRFLMQRLSFVTGLLVFLEAGFLVSKKTVAEIIGVKDNPAEGFHLDLEDYLMGLLQLSSELARFSVNAVTRGDYSRPLQISKFVAELNAGFRLLNMKNDNLRKRFDALKYDAKKIEEVVYDLSIRGLTPTGHSTSPTHDNKEGTSRSTADEGRADAVGNAGPNTGGTSTGAAGTGGANAGGADAGETDGAENTSTD